MMDGYLINENNTLKIDVTNVKEFEKLLSKAREEAEKLNETIKELERFQLNIKFNF